MKRTVVVVVLVVAAVSAAGLLFFPAAQDALFRWSDLPSTPPEVSPPGTIRLPEDAARGVPGPPRPQVPASQSPGDGGSGPAVRVLVPLASHRSSGGDASAAPRLGEAMRLLALGPDDSAVLVRVGNRTRPGPTDLHFLRLPLSGATAAEWREPALSKLFFEGGSAANPAEKRLLEAKLADPALAEDLVRHAAALREAGAPGGRDERFAVSPSGDRVALNVGDYVFVADGRTGKGLRRLYERPSYNPAFSPDGRTIYFTCLHGMRDSVEANYDLCAVPTSTPGTAAAPRPPAFLARGADRLLAVSADGGHVFVEGRPPAPSSSQPLSPASARCVVRVDLGPSPPKLAETAKAGKATVVACADSFAMTPNVEALVAVTGAFRGTMSDAGPEAPPRTATWVDPATGVPLGSAPFLGDVVALRNDGYLVATAFTKRLESCLELLDFQAKTRTLTRRGTVPFGLLPGGARLEGTHLYAEAFGLGLVAIDLARIPRGPSSPLGERPPGECPP